jgi:hypothetical protein
MRSLKETVFYMAAMVLQQASQRLMLAAFREHVKTCPNHRREETGATNHKVN